MVVFSKKPYNNLVALSIFLSAKETYMFRRKDIFLTTLEKMADTVIEAMEFFAQNISDLSDVTHFAKRMKELESKCDRYTHVIYKELNKTFITPIEREDILALASTLDDVVDGVEACASRIEMYNIRGKDEHLATFADILVRSAHEIKTAISLLSQKKKLLAILKPCIALNKLENEADECLRTSITLLFAQVKDPIELIKRKEIYEKLEQTTDSCEDVAHIFESIVMRNS